MGGSRCGNGGSHRRSGGYDRDERKGYGGGRRDYDRDRNDRGGHDRGGDRRRKR